MVSSLSLAYNVQLLLQTDCIHCLHEGRKLFDSKFVLRCIGEAKHRVLGIETCTHASEFVTSSAGF